jgi:hypothetical protein
MEVHDHPAMPKGEKKPFKEYDPIALKRFAGRIGIFRNLADMRLEGMLSCQAMLVRNIEFLRKTYHLSE